MKGKNRGSTKPQDGGASWELQYTDKRKAFFLDAISCWNETHCFALSDPVDGKFLLLRTEDGTHWSELPRDNMPAALANEGAFAASNSSLTIYDGREIYFATGGASRVFRSKDLGKTWTVYQTPVDQWQSIVRNFFNRSESVGCSGGGRRLSGPEKRVQKCSSFP